MTQNDLAWAARRSLAADPRGNLLNFAASFRKACICSAISSFEPTDSSVLDPFDALVAIVYYFLVLNRTKLYIKYDLFANTLRLKRLVKG